MNGSGHTGRVIDPTRCVRYVRWRMRHFFTISLCQMLFLNAASGSKKEEVRNLLVSSHHAYHRTSIAAKIRYNVPLAEEIITEVPKHQPRYDHGCKDDHDAHRKKNLWLAIAIQFDIDESIVSSLMSIVYKLFVYISTLSFLWMGSMCVLLISHIQCKQACGFLTHLAA